MTALRGARIDVVIATIALLVSAGATVSSIYQTHVVANQLSASVWPYLSIESDLAPATYELSVSNDGLGPALIRAATLRVDGAVVTSYRDAASRIARAPLVRGDKRFHGGFASVDSTTVVRVADRHVFINATGTHLSSLGDLGKRVSLELCYCSLLDQCWDVRSGRPQTAVSACVPNAGIDY